MLGPPPACPRCSYTPQLFIGRWFFSIPLHVLGQGRNRWGQFGPGCPRICGALHRGVHHPRVSRDRLSLHLQFHHPLEVLCLIVDDGSCYINNFVVAVTFPSPVLFVLDNSTNNCARRRIPPMTHGTEYGVNRTTLLLRGTAVEYVPHNSGMAV